MQAVKMMHHGNAVRKATRPQSWLHDDAELQQVLDVSLMPTVFAWADAFEVAQPHTGAIVSHSYFAEPQGDIAPRQVLEPVSYRVPGAIAPPSKPAQNRIDLSIETMRILRDGLAAKRKDGGVSPLSASFDAIERAGGNDLKLHAEQIIGQLLSRIGAKASIGVWPADIALMQLAPTLTGGLTKKLMFTDAIIDEFQLRLPLRPDWLTAFLDAVLRDMVRSIPDGTTVRGRWGKIAMSSGQERIFFQVETK